MVSSRRINEGSPGTLGRGQTGDIDLHGHRDSCLLRVDGLEDIRREPDGYGGAGMGARRRSSAIGLRSQRVAGPSPHREPRPLDRDAQRAPLARRLAGRRMEAEQVEDPRLVRDAIKARREVVGVADGEAAGVRSQALGACRFVGRPARRATPQLWTGPAPPRSPPSSRGSSIDRACRGSRWPHSRRARAGWFPQGFPQLGIRVLDEALRDEEKGLAATNVREGLQLPTQGGVGETRSIAPSSLDLLGDGPVPARLSLHDGMRLRLGTWCGGNQRVPCSCSSCALWMSANTSFTPTWAGPRRPNRETTASRSSRPSGTRALHRHRPP